MTMMDRSTRWLEATPVRDMAAATCADTLIAAWVARFGVPAVITSDRGTQFTSQLWSQLWSCPRTGDRHCIADDLWAGVTWTAVHTGEHTSYSMKKWNGVA